MGSSETWPEVHFVVHSATNSNFLCKIVCWYYWNHCTKFSILKCIYKEDLDDKMRLLIYSIDLHQSNPHLHVRIKAEDWKKRCPRLHPSYLPKSRKKIFHIRVKKNLIFLAVNLLKDSGKNDERFHIWRIESL